MLPQKLRVPIQTLTEPIFRKRVALRQRLKRKQPENLWLMVLKILKLRT